MSRSIRGIGLVASCAAMIAMVWPSAAPVAGDVIVSNLKPASIALDVPMAAPQGLPFSPIRIQNELDVDQTPRVSPIAAAREVEAASAPSSAPALDLAALVGDVADMHRTELDRDMRCLASAI